MDPEKNSPKETAEELEAEKQSLADVKEDEIRGKVISEYGFDAEDDKERIDKLVARELHYHGKLKEVIGQKIKYREAGKVIPPKDEESGKDSVDIDTRITERLEQERLDDMEYPDDIKTVIKNVAKNTGVSVKQAVKDEYVQSRITKWRKESGADEAAVNRNDKSGKGKGSGGDSDEIPDFDLTTEEGRKDWDEWKEDQIKAGN